MDKVLSFRDITYSYDGCRMIFREMNYTFEKGVFYAIVGPSGSGKTTALSLAAALDSPKSGSVLFRDKDIKSIGYAKYRREAVALVFQSYNLINYLTARENVMMGMEIAGRYHDKRKARADTLLAAMGLSADEADRRVNGLSGGQQQRVAIARALSTNAEIILADEPTGNLDPDTAVGIINLFKGLVEEQNKCVIVVTHSVEVSKCADKVLEIRGGALCEVG